MSRLLKLGSLLVISLVSVSCGYVAVSGVFRPGTQTVTGVVSVVQFRFVNGTSSLTIVTLIDTGNANTLNFCGDQRGSFPMNQMVNASFSPGTNCDSLISVSFP